MMIAFIFKFHQLTINVIKFYLDTVRYRTIEIEIICVVLSIVGILVERDAMK